jgi:chaperonin GroEL (HSP60 family)
MAINDWFFAMRVAATLTGDIAGDGTTTAVVLAEALVTRPTW